RPKLGQLEINKELRKLVMSKLELKWSPEQIAGWLRVEYPCNPFMHVSYETIYKSIYVRSKAVIHFSFAQHLRRSHPMRHSRYRRRRGDRTCTTIVNGLSTRESDGDIESRGSLGHWGGDLVAGSKNRHSARRVERQPRFTIL